MYVVKEFGFEGILAKRADSFYESGKRSGARLNYRINKGQEFVIGGYVPNNPIDSIIVGYCDDGKLLYVGKVRNGFVTHTRRAVASRFTGLKSDTCPFANPPEKKRTQWALTKDEMKNCRWLKPERIRRMDPGRPLSTFKSSWDCGMIKTHAALRARTTDNKR